MDFKDENYEGVNEFKENEDSNEDSETIFQQKELNLSQ